MIDQTNGHLILSSRVELKPGDKFAAIKKLKLGAVQEVDDMKNGFCWLTLKNVKVDKEYFILAICFKNKLLKSIDLSVSEKKINLNSGWDSWSEKDEKKKLSLFRKWIKKEVGKEGKFKWGNITTEYDPKGASTSILVRYR